MSYYQMGSISYLESRLNKMYEETRGKLRERRRQDVRDQADILAAQSNARDVNRILIVLKWFLCFLKSKRYAFGLENFQYLEEAPDLDSELDGLVTTISFHREQL